MDLWQQAQQVFDAALQYPPHKRQEFLEQACGANEELRREVESLLAAHDKSGSFMREPALTGLADVPHRATSRLRPGDTLGVYKVLALVGSGGMGEVYRAQDPRLKREVAIKVLPQAFAADSERLRRFEQEARAAAALNHPNIVAVHDMGTADGSPYIVAELLEGQNLGGVLRQGPVPPRKALDYAIQALRGLAAAHDADIIHRDLKPENLFITKDGQVKILDFGLAKLTRSDAFGTESGSGETRPQTEAGSVFGTIGYMSPEQVRGQAADHRSDIFSFGCILYELFSGHRAFSGESPADTLSAILHQEPPELTRATPPVHPAIDCTIRHCLEKNPLERFQSAHDLRFQLETATKGVFPQTGRDAGDLQGAISRLAARSRMPVWVWAILIGLTVASTAVAIAVFNKPARMTLVRASVLPAEGTTFNLRPDHPGPVSVSPDGRHLAFTARRGYGVALLWIRSLDSDDARVLPGTEGAGYPFWSPDARSLGFFAAGKLKRISVDGGPPVTLCDAPIGKGGTWSPDGAIIFAPSSHGPLMRVSADGGTSQPVTRINASAYEDSHRLPQFLPDGRHFLFFVRRTAGRDAESGAVHVGSLDDDGRKLLLRSSSNAVYASGYLLFLRSGTLLAQLFDTKRLELTGEAMVVASSVRSIPSANVSIVSASNNAVLVYQTGPAQEAERLIWLDRAGKAVGTLGEPARIDGFAISPNGETVAIAVDDPLVGTTDIWLNDVRGGLRERFTFEPGSETAPLWAPDGSRIVFASNRNGQFDLFWKPIRGPAGEKLLLASDVEKYATSWSRDGQFIAFMTRDRIGREDIWLLRLTGESKPAAILQGDFDRTRPAISPDSRWLAYESGETGRREVYLTGLPDGGRHWQVSVDGGQVPLWRGDGRELFYLSPIGKLIAAELSFEGASVRVIGAKPLFDLDTLNFDVTADGQRFLVSIPVGESKLSPVTLVLNWTTTSKK